MIKFNETYTINNGHESIEFKEVKGNTVTGEYNDGTLTGTIDGNLLKGTFHNKKSNVSGLIEITFHENGFDAIWKQGLEPGPMRGKWDGKLSSTGNYYHHQSTGHSTFNDAKVRNLEVFIRYSDGDTEVGSFSIEIESTLHVPSDNEITYENLTHLISYEGLFDDQPFLEAVKKEVSDFSLRMSDCPQLFVTKINNLDLKPLYDYHFKDEDNLENVVSLLNIESDEIHDFLSDYFHETAYSVENLF